MDKKKKILISIIMLVLLAGIIFVLITALSPAQIKQPVQISLPDAQAEDIPRAKIRVYSSEDKQVSNYDEYLARITSVDLTDNRMTDKVSDTLHAENRTAMLQAQKDLAATIRKAQQSAKEPEKKEKINDTQTNTTSSRKKDDWKERYDYMYEKIYKQPEPQSAIAAVPAETEEKEKADGFITVIGADVWAQKNNIYVTTTSQIQVSNGDKVQLRLLQEAVINNVTIPRNTYIYAIASVSDNRLQLSVSNIPYRSGILNCTLSAYDTDGYKGLAFVNASAPKELNSELVSGLSNVASSAASGVSNIASRVISSTSRLASKRNQDKQRLVTIPQDYRFILK